MRIKTTNEYVQSKIVEKFQLYARGRRQLRLRIDNRIKSANFLASIAKAAYSGLFVDRGYKYILMPSLDRVREAIRDSGAFWVLLPPMNNPNDGGWDFD